MIVGGSKCVFANLAAREKFTSVGTVGEEPSPCQGRLEWHHAVTKSRLKRFFGYGALWDHDKWIPAGRYDPVTRSDEHGRTLDDILGDTRNRVWLCQAHHERVTNGRLKVQLPDSVWEFAREFGLDAQLENDLRRAA